MGIEGTLKVVSQVPWYTRINLRVERPEMLAVAPFNRKTCKKPQFASIAVATRSIGKNTAVWSGGSLFNELTVSDKN